MSFTIKELVTAKKKVRAASDDDTMKFHDLLMNEGAKNIVEMLIGYLKDLPDDFDGIEDYQHDVELLKTVVTKLKT